MSLHKKECHIIENGGVPRHDQIETTYGCVGTAFILASNYKKNMTREIPILEIPNHLIDK